MTSDSILYLDDYQLAPKVTIRPLVLMNIGECYFRRNVNQNRVIGALLGQRLKNEIVVTNSFSVLLDESDEEVMVNMDYQAVLYKQYQKINPKEILLGWYSTGHEINDRTLLIHEYYGMCCEDPIYMTVDTEMIDGNMSVRCYQTIQFGAPMGRCNGLAFSRMLSSISCSDNLEEIAVDMLQRVSKADHPVDLFTEEEHLRLALEELLSLIIRFSNFTQLVISKKTPANTQIGRVLFDIINSIPEVKEETFDSLVNNNLRDMLMIIYLTNIIKTQLGIAERLYLCL